jgi:hypothetical protein
LSASYSTVFHPTPTPSRNRLPDRIATSAACLATSTVWRCGRMRIAVTSSTVVVHAARNPNSTIGSWNAVFESYGPSKPPGRLRSTPTTWS